MCHLWHISHRNASHHSFYSNNTGCLVSSSVPNCTFLNSTAHRRLTRPAHIWQSPSPTNSTRFHYGHPHSCCCSLLWEFQSCRGISPWPLTPQPGSLPSSYYYRYFYEPHQMAAARLPGRTGSALQRTAPYPKTQDFQTSDARFETREQSFC